jgi:hypothetical protein
MRSGTTGDAAAGGVVRAGPARGFDVEAKPCAAVVALGHLGHHAGDLQVAPFEAPDRKAPCA